MKRCAILDSSEGLSIGGTAFPLTDPTHPLGYAVRLFDCFFQQRPPGEGTEVVEDYHGDTIQAVDDDNGGTPLMIRNCYMGSVDRLGYAGASSVIGNYYDNQQPPDVDRLLMSGGAITLRNFCGGDWRHVYIENNTWAFYPVGTPEDAWPAVTTWDVVTCTLGGDGQPDELIARIPFGWPGYGPLDPV